MAEATIEETKLRLKQLPICEQFIAAAVHYDPITGEPVAVETEQNGLIKLRARKALQACIFALPWSQDDLGSTRWGSANWQSLKRAYPIPTAYQANIEYRVSRSVFLRFRNFRVLKVIAHKADLLMFLRKKDFSCHFHFLPLS